MVPPITRTNSVAPITQPAKAVEPQTRFHGAVDSPVRITMDAKGERGSFSADVPLDSFKPPLSRDALAGLSIRVGLPPNSELAAPATVIQKNGRSYLHVELPLAEVNALKSAPITVSVGPAASLVGTMTSPKFMLQINAKDLSVDATPMTLAATRDARAGQAKFIASLEQNKAQMIAGTDSWFGNRQLETENERLTRDLATNTAALAPKLAAAEAALAAAKDHEAAFSMPTELSAERDTLTPLAHAASNLTAKVRELEEKRRMFEVVPSELPAIDAELIPLRAEAEARTADVHGQITALYPKTRTERPELADRWLQRHATTFHRPDAAQLTELLSTQRGLKMSLEINTSDLAKLKARHLENAPKVIEQLTARIAAANQRLVELDAEIVDLRDGAVTNVQAFSTTYPPDKSFI